MVKCRKQDFAFRMENWWSVDVLGGVLAAEFVEGEILNEAAASGQEGWRQK